jgi:hypothetical protein
MRKDKLCLVDTANAELSGMLEIEASDAGMHLIGWLPHGLMIKCGARRLAA